MNKLFKLLLCLFLSLVCICVPRNVDADLSSGIYIYTGRYPYEEGTPFSDDINDYCNQLEVGLGENATIRIVKIDGDNKTLVSNDELNYNPSQISIGPSREGVTFDIILNCAEKRDFTLKGTDYTVSLIPTLVNGLFAYTNMDGDYSTDNDLSHFTTQFGLGPTLTNDCYIVFINEGSRSLLKAENLTTTASGVEIKDNEGGSVKITSSVAQNFILKYESYELGIIATSSGAENGCANYTIDNKKYYFGLNMFNNDETDRVFLNDVIDIPKREFEYDFPMILIAGLSTKDTQAAPANVCNMISNIAINITNNTIGNKISYTIGENKITAFERNVYFVNFHFDSEAVGNALVECSFDLNIPNEETKHLTCTYQFRIPEPRKYVLELTEEDMVENIFNNIFSSRHSLFQRAGLQDSEDVNEFTIVLPVGAYKGDYKFDVSEYHGGSGSRWFRVKGNVDEDGNKKTTIVGTMEVNGGIVSFDSINFNADYVDDGGQEIFATPISEQTLNIENKTVGIITRKTTAQTDNADAIEVFRCDFNNYDYALVSTNTGYVGGICECYFNNNGYCYYMDCQGTDYFSNGPASQYNEFVNSTNAAIAFVSTPGNIESYAWRFMNNDFINDFTGERENASDYYIEQDGEVGNIANYYCMYSYYGSKEGKMLDPNNLRSARINYGNTEYARVITNPCVKYYGSACYHLPEEEMEGSPLGIDNDGELFTAIFKGSNIAINGNDIANIKNIEIVTLDGKDTLGGLVHE